MANFVYDDIDISTALYGVTSNVPGRLVTNEATQITASKLNNLRAALDETRKTIIGQSFSVKAYGAIGDGAHETADTDAFLAAIDAAETEVTGGAYGAFVVVPKGLYTLGSQIALPNGVGLRGAGPTASVLKASNTFSGTSLVTNADHAGTQEFCFLEGLQIEGNKGGGAVCSVAVVDLVSLFINSYVRDCVILNGSNVGLRVAGVNGMGPVFFENLWVLRHNGHNILVEEVVGNTHGLNGLCFVNIASEHQGTNSSALYLKGLGHSQGWTFINIHIEQGTAATGRTGITIDGVSHVLIQNVQLEADIATVTAGIVITNVVQNVGIEIKKVTNQNLINPVVLDLKNGVLVGALNIEGSYVTPDVRYRGGLRFTPHTTTGSKSLVAQSSAGVDRAWFNDLGQISGSSFNGAGLDIQADSVNDRAVILVNNAADSTYGFHYPAAGGGVLRFTRFTNASDIFQVSTAGALFVYQASTFQLAATFQSGIVNGAGIRHTNEIAPTQLTANVDNYAPTGASTATVWILTSDASRDITGFAAPTTGRTIWVYNNGAQNIVLKNEVTSTAANRITGRGGGDTTLTPKTGVQLYYSPSITRWLVVGDTL